MAARRFNFMIYATILLCCLNILILCLSTATTKWFQGEAVPMHDSETVQYIEFSYGLFSGHKTKYLGEQTRHYDLKNFDVYSSVICSAADGKCMYSCGITGEDRRQDLDGFLAGELEVKDALYCIDTSQQFQLPQSQYKSGKDPMEENHRDNEETDDEAVFLNFYFWLLSIMSLVLGILFNFIAACFGLLNSFSAPTQPIFSVFGLYIWNGGALVGEFFVLLFWGLAHITRLKDNASFSDTIALSYTNSGFSSIGYSYWILLIPLISSISNVAILRFRTWKIQKLLENDIRVMNSDLKSPETLLF